jgi:hypothetical protein
MTDLFSDFLAEFDARLQRHEVRMAAINDEHRRRNDAILARLQLELDALAERVAHDRP